MIKTILITGGGGFIGSHILELLLKNKYKVIVLERSRDNNGRIKRFLPKIKTYYSTDGNLAEVFQKNKIDCVIHLAALYIKDHETVSDVENVIESNIKFSATLAELCVENGVKYFINTGSSFEYGNVASNIKEGHEKAPLSLYAVSKVASSEVFKYYARDRGLRVADLLLFAPFGDGDNEKLFAYLIKSMIDNVEVDFSGGEQRWNYTYVKDIALAYLCAIKNFERIKGYEEFNVGYNKAYSIKEIVSKLEKLAHKRLKIKWGAKPYAKNEYLFFNCENSKLKKILGWRPKYNFDYGLLKTYDYYLDYYTKEKK